MHPLLLSALIQVESHGNDHARGKHGELGALQIKSIMVRDVNRIMGTDFRWEGMTNRADAIMVSTIYLNHYVTEKRLGRKPTLADFARIWNSGPDGFKKTVSDNYVKKFEAALRKQNENYATQWSRIPNR
jgi:soluble lytic murein transglycosylase-like protein